MKFKVINQHKIDTCHVQSLEKDFYLGTLSSPNLKVFGSHSFENKQFLKPIFTNQVLKLLF
jgi:hypothetical protein